MKLNNYFLIGSCITLGIIIGIFSSNYIKPSNVQANSIPYSDFNMNCEYLQKTSNDLGVGYLYRCKAPNGWILIHHNKGAINNLYIPDPTYSWK